MTRSHAFARQRLVSPVRRSDALSEMHKDIAAERAKLFKAGYVDPLNNRYYTHLPCGRSVPNPNRHDPVCPENGNGRTEPMLSDL